MNPALLLIVEPEDLRTRLRRELGDAGWTVLEPPAGGDVAAAVSICDVALVGLQAVSGFAGLRALIEHAADTAILVTSVPGSEEEAVESLRRGAFDYVGPAVDKTRLLLAAQKALEVSRLRREVAVCRAQHAQDHGFDAIVGASPQIARVRALVARATEADQLPVLLVGEHGTGKHLIARVLHFNSARAGRSFLEVTCTGLSEEALASALFGHERGAFPGARSRARGLLERAAGGTVLIDEIGTLPPRLQTKLLRLLDDGSLTRAGGLDPIRVDVRIVGAHRHPLDAGVSAGTFDRDLAARLQPAALWLPSLRERPGDIPLLANHYVGRFNDDLRRVVRGFTDDASSVLAGYAWPGNVRELRNAIERAMVIVDGDLIRPVDLTAIAAPGSTVFRLPAEGVAIEEVERQFVAQALERTGGNQTRAAQLLGLNRDQIRYRIEKFGLSIR